MLKKVFKKPCESTESAPNTTTDDQKPSTPCRRTPAPRSNLTSKSEIVPGRKSPRYYLTKEDLDFIKLYTKHFPRVVHRVRPPSRSKRKQRRQSECGESEMVEQTAGQSGHTYELAEALCKIKERPLASGVQGQMRLIGALRRLDQDRERAWKCWMQRAMRREAEHINNMRLSIINTRAQNLQDVGPDWYQQLSWEQMETVNKLEMTLYQDIDETTTSKTQCLLRDLGLEPPPSHHVVRCVMNNSKDDPCKFLIELYKATSPHGRLPGEDNPDAGGEEKEDGNGEGGGTNRYRTGFEYSLDERLILSALAHLRIGNVLHHLNEGFGKPNTHLPYFRMVMPPCQKRQKKSGQVSTWPYLQPLYIPEYNWLEPKLIQDAIYAQNLYMTLHRVPPPVPRQLRPIPYTHIQIPEDLKPRRYKSAETHKRQRRRAATGSQDTGGSHTVLSSNGSNQSRSLDETATKIQRASKTTLGTDIVSMGSQSIKESNKNGRRRKRQCRPSVAAKPRRRFLPAWLKRLGESSKMCIDESSRPSTPLMKHPPAGFPQRPHRNQKNERSSDSKEQKNDQVAKKGDSRLSRSQGLDQTNPLDSLEVARFLPDIPDEPLVKLGNLQELPAIQKWIRMKNGLLYIHPVIAVKLLKRSKALWRVLEGGRCSMIQGPELCLTKHEERLLTWDHIDWLRRESNRVVEEYYRTCFEMQVALAREFYPSMATDYFRNRDKFLKIYFTYLPSRPQDCFRRPWQKSEYNREIYNRWKKRFQEMEASKNQEKGSKDKKII